jgi:DNA modification methylase
MKPYYEQDGITIYHGDCRDVLPSLRRESIDLVITDPPYGMKFQSNYRTMKLDAIHGDDSTEAAIEATRLAIPMIRSGRHLYVFGRYDFSGLPLCQGAELVWDKGAISMGDLSLPWGSQHEYIQFLIAHDSAPKVADRGKLSARLRQGTVLRIPRPQTGQHPTEKPVLLIRRLIESSSCIGDTVLDYFAGIGSTMVACRLEGRKAIGIELEEKYCEIAAKRLAQGALPMEFSA